MARKKRSQKQGAVAVPVERAVTKRVPAAVRESLQALCPVCGKTIVDRAVKVGGISVGMTPYFETIDWDPNKPFGVAKMIGGRGSFSDWRYITPEEAPEMFDQVKARFMDALGEWLAKGWITAAEVRSILSSV